MVGAQNAHGSASAIRQQNSFRFACDHISRPGLSTKAGKEQNGALVRHAVKIKRQAVFAQELFGIVDLRNRQFLLRAPDDVSSLISQPLPNLRLGLRWDFKRELHPGPETSGLKPKYLRLAAVDFLPETVQYGKLGDQLFGAVIAARKLRIGTAVRGRPGTAVGILLLLLNGIPLWNNNWLLLNFAALLLALTAAFNAFAAEIPDHSPQLLLNSQRLRRLKRDRERQTQRWVNFENRVNSQPNSPERGFELALYYAITGEPGRGKEAVQWVLAHACERRQVALVLDWAASLVSGGERARLAAQNCPAQSPENPASLRDAVFLKIAAGEDIAKLVEDSRKPLTTFLVDGGFQDAAELYAASEYMMAVRSAQNVDVREDDSTFFLQLPTEFLLALKPGQLDNPGWMIHIAALALVALDPNLESSQFLQGWAIAERQMAREGPGVAYELLWADPYLPGIGYQNMNRWAYDPKGHLFARMDWEPNSCAIEISGSAVKEENLPAWVA